MTTIKDNHLLSVYVPEVGTPQALEVIKPTSVSSDVLNTGSLVCSTTSTATIDGVTDVINTVGVGLSVDIRIVNGELSSVNEINDAGLGYTANEIIEVDYQDDAAGNKAKLKVVSIDEDGAVQDLQVYENGDSYKVVNGVIDTLELVGNNGDKIAVDVEISNSDFDSVSLNNVSLLIPTEFAEVGGELNVVDSSDNVQGQVRVVTIGSKVSGGLHKYSGAKLTEDVKEIIANEIPPIITENVDYNPRGVFSPQGEITYSEDLGVLTYHRSQPFNKELTDILYVKRDGDEIAGTYNFTDLSADNANPTDIINITNSEGEALKINSTGVVNQPNVNIPVEDGDLVNKKYIDDIEESNKNEFENLHEIGEVIKELLEFDAFGNPYNVEVVSSPPASLDDGIVYLLTSETPTEVDYSDNKNKVVSFDNVTQVFISNNDSDGNEVFSDFTIFDTNSELTLNQLKIELGGGFGRYLVKSAATILSDGAMFEVHPYRVSQRLISEVDEAPTDGIFRQAEVSLLLRTSAVLTYDEGDDRYVNKEGDTMTGALVMDNASMIETVNTDIEMRRTMPSDGTGNWDANRSRYGIIRSRCPKFIEADGSENLANNEPFGIQIDLADRNSYRNEFKITNKTENILRVYSGITPGIDFNNQIDRSTLADNKGIEKGIEIRGIPTPDKDLTPGSYAVNKEYIDQRESFLQNEIAVLQEEIEAIIPTTDKGIWQDGASATPGTGHFSMRLEGGAITQNYEDTTIDRIIISTTAKDGSAHSFLTEEVGDLIQLFDVEDKNYGLFEIEAIDTNSSSDYVSFDVKWLQGLGETHVDDDVLVKTFSPPSGGTASEFLPLVGGTMTGPVMFEDTPFNGVTVTGNSGPTYNNPSRILFRAENGGSFSGEPHVLIGVEPTEDNHAVTKKFVDNKFDFRNYTELS